MCVCVCVCERESECVCVCVVTLSCISGDMSIMDCERGRGS